ncbi:MAG: hypothetical protein MZV70_35500 [Desulfobacterales bacterium]|nr:hypothetical protein [Desulfobacterales bacterium]
MPKTPAWSDAAARVTLLAQAPGNLPMKHQRLASRGSDLPLRSVSGRVHPRRPGQLPPPSQAADEPSRASFEKPDNEYFYFLATQKERRAGARSDKAILSLRKAIEIDPDSSYLQPRAGDHLPPEQGGSQGA